MNHRAPSDPLNLAPRGGVYILVLGAATMIAVVGLGTIAVTRSEIKSSAAARDWARAGVLAESAVETGLARMNTSSTWRIDYSAGAEVSIGAAGTASASFRLLDPADGDLEKFDQDSAKLVGYGRVGEAVRLFSVQAAYRPPPVLDVLTYALYAATLRAGGATVSGAPAGASALNNTASLTANVRVATLTNTGTIIGEVRTGETPITTFSDGSLTSLASSAVTISYNGLPSGGEIRRVLLSAAVNPFGSPSSTGVYFVRVPAGKSLSIRECRIVATLIIELGLGAQILLSDQVNWDRPGPNLPTLVIYATGASQVQLSGASGTLSESSAGSNFNPPSTPYNGVSNSSPSDTYPSEIRGIIHVLGTLPSLQIGTGLTVVGTVIVEGTLNISGGSKITYDPQILQNPPTAYRTGSSGMTPIAGTWTWELLP